MDNYEYILNIISVINKPKTLKEIEMALDVLLMNYTEEDKKSLALLLYSIVSRKEVSGIPFKSRVVDLISNRSHKLKTVGDYNTEFDRLYEGMSKTVANNTQCKEYGGLKYLEVIIMYKALSLHFNSTDDHKVISMVDVVDMMVDIIGGPANLYWYYIYKWSDLGLINYGTSIKYVWFELKNFKTPGNERYLKILKVVKEDYNENQGRDN